VSQRGFSLVELLVALAILALALGMALPFVSGGSSMRELDATARQIAAALRDARSEAIRRNRPVSFEIDLARRVIGHERPIILPQKPDQQLTLYTATNLQDGASHGAIRFFPDGGASGGGIAVSAASGRMVVEVDWLSGGITLRAERGQR
jgi:general secretion pathway protein H